jgi:hypothetical protein
MFGGRPSSGGLHLLVDSTGINMTGEGEWKTRKHGASCRRQWRKVHLGMDAETMDIRAIEITTNEVGDAPVLSDRWRRFRRMSGLQPLVRTAPTTRGSVTPRSPSVMPKPSFRSAEMGSHGRKMVQALVFATKRSAPSSGSAGRSGKKWSGYHRRSLVETKMHCFKRLGPRVASRTLDRQTTELKVRAKISQSLFTNRNAHNDPRRLIFANNTSIMIRSSYATKPSQPRNLHMRKRQTVFRHPLMSAWTIGFIALPRK